MRYISTRGGAEAAGFSDVLLRGLAPDGGLYVPAEWPELDIAELRALRGRPYAEVAEAVFAPFVGDAIPRERLRLAIGASCAAFDHALVAPLVQTGPSDWILELFHGPTLAFKDVALQLLARLFEEAIGEEGHLTIVGATSGDTGSAAIEAIRGRRGMRIVILHPEGRVSEVQRRQMTTVPDANVRNIAVAGTFDDCQRVLKELFADRVFAREVALSGINSINWARIMAQAVYYVTSGLALGAPERPATFVVPTGNFGDVYAGFVAHKLGLPVRRLAIATNVNDILVRTLKTGRYEIRGVTPTSSPSMDIEVSSNFERLVFEAVGRDGSRTAVLFGGLQQSGAFDLPEPALRAMRDLFVAASASEAEVATAIARMRRSAARLFDPHTAVGVHVLAALRASGAIPMEEPAVVLATAHPAKFPEAVAKAAGLKPELPARFAGLMSRPERFERLPADAAAIKAHIRSLR